MNLPWHPSRSYVLCGSRNQRSARRKTWIYMSTHYAIRVSRTLGCINGHYPKIHQTASDIFPGSSYFVSTVSQSYYFCPCLLTLFSSRSQTPPRTTQNSPRLSLHGLRRPNGQINGTLSTRHPFRRERCHIPKYDQRAPHSLRTL